VAQKNELCAKQSFPTNKLNEVLISSNESQRAKIIEGKEKDVYSYRKRSFVSLPNASGIGPLKLFR
jgi:hypothetical protein